MDEGAGLALGAILTPANVNESVADALSIDDEAAVYADKGSDSAARKTLLAERGSFGGIMRRGHPQRPLTDEEVARKRALVPIRSAIERVFGTLKRSYGWVRVRYRGSCATPPASTCPASPSTCAGSTSSPDGRGRAWLRPRPYGLPVAGHLGRSTRSPAT